MGRRVTVCTRKRFFLFTFPPRLQINRFRATEFEITGLRKNPVAQEFVIRTCISNSDLKIFSKRSREAIDLALITNSERHSGSVKTDLEELPTPYSFDVIDYQRITHKPRESDLFSFRS